MKRAAPMPPSPPTPSGRRRGRAALALLALAGCALLYPKRVERIWHLLPVAASDAHYAVADSVVSYAAEGLRIEVEHVTDRALNEEFPVEPPLGEPAIHAYTYGDRVDPAVGYVPSRFTVFRVTVYNLGLAKVELRPTRCLLTTDRGDRLPAYALLHGDAPKSLEAYYRALRGPGGNEHYRFTQRMAVVRAHNYLAGEPIQKGESYGGFIVFDPLDDAVRDATLHIRDFVVRANAYGKPLETIDLDFPFHREVVLRAYHEQGRRAQGASVTRANLSAPSRVVGELAGDLTREPAAIDAFVRTRLDELNGCFEAGYIAGTAVPGQVVVDFTVLAHGGVETAAVTSAAVGSDDVSRCVEARVRRWNLGPAVVVAPLADAQDSLATPAGRSPQAAAPTRVYVSSTLDFGPVDGGAGDAGAEATDSLEPGAP